MKAARGILGGVAPGQNVAAIRNTERKRIASEAAADKLTLSTLLDDLERLALAPHRGSYRKNAVRAVKAAFPRPLDRAPRHLDGKRGLAVSGVRQPLQPNLLLTLLNELPTLEPIVLTKAAIAMITALAITAYSMAVTPLLGVCICLINAKSSMRDNVPSPGSLFCG